MQTTLEVLGRAFSVECSEQEERRLRDLARALDARLAGFGGDPDAMRRLVLSALALLDEAQATGAALVRARGEIERLTDLLVEAKLAAEPEAVNAERGRLGALRVAQGAA